MPNYSLFRCPDYWEITPLFGAIQKDEEKKKKRMGPSTGSRNNGRILHLFLCQITHCSAVQIIGKSHHCSEQFKRMKKKRRKGWGQVLVLEIMEGFFICFYAKLLIVPLSRLLGNHTIVRSNSKG